MPITRQLRNLIWRLCSICLKQVIIENVDCHKCRLLHPAWKLDTTGKWLPLRTATLGFYILSHKVCLLWQWLSSYASVTDAVEIHVCQTAQSQLQGLTWRIQHCVFTFVHFLCHICIILPWLITTIKNLCQFTLDLQFYINKKRETFILCFQIGFSEKPK